MGKSETSSRATPLQKIKEAIRDAKGRCLGAFTMKGNVKQSLELWGINGRTHVLLCQDSGEYMLFGSNGPDLDADIRYIQWISKPRNELTSEDIESAIDAIADALYPQQNKTTTS